MKITAINTGGRTGEEVIINGAPGSIDNDANIANMAFTIGDNANTKTTIENADITALAPNGGTAYLSSKGVEIEVKSNSNFTFFELPREKNFNQTKLTAILPNSVNVVLLDFMTKLTVCEPATCLLSN